MVMSIGAQDLFFSRYYIIITTQQGIARDQGKMYSRSTSFTTSSHQECHSFYDVLFVIYS
jgi:hypothetical protein